MKPPLVRFICAQHKSRTLGRLVPGPNGPVYLGWIPNEFRNVRAPGEAQVPHPKDEIAFEINAPFAHLVPYVLAWCPDCRTLSRLELGMLREAVKHGDSVRVIPAQVRKNHGSAVLPSLDN